MKPAAPVISVVNSCPPLVAAAYFDLRELVSEGGSWIVDRPRSLLMGGKSKFARKTYGIIAAG